MQFQNNSLLTGCLVIFTVFLVFLTYLCALDIYFVMYKNEVRGWYNTATLLIFAMPLVLAGTGYRLLPRPANVIFAFVSIPIGLVISYAELLWVATEFHTMIGGTI